MPLTLITQISCRSRTLVTELNIHTWPRSWRNWRKSRTQRSHRPSCRLLQEVRQLWRNKLCTNYEMAAISHRLQILHKNVFLSTLTHRREILGNTVRRPQVYSLSELLFDNLALKCIFKITLNLQIKIITQSCLHVRQCTYPKNNPNTNLCPERDPKSFFFFLHFGWCLILVYTSLVHISPLVSFTIYILRY